MGFVQHTTKFGESSFKSCPLSVFLLLSKIKISLIVGLRFCLKSICHFPSKNGYGCYR